MPHPIRGGQLVYSTSTTTPATRDGRETVAVTAGMVPRRPSTYFHERLAALGLPPARAREYGLSVDDQGNILQYVRSFSGNYLEFVPEEHRRQLDRLRARRTLYHLHDQQFFRRLAVRRLHPETLRLDPTLPKYKNEAGQRVRPLPTPSAIAAFNGRTVGGTIAFIEGYFKAVALDLGGVESVAFTGISVYRLDDSLREYLRRRRPSRILIMYDADALDLTSATKSEASKCKALSSRRQLNFLSSAQSFAAQLFQLFKQLGHTCSVCFLMGHPDAGRKGLDDLITTFGSAAVIGDLLNFNLTCHFQQSAYFAGYTLAPSSYRRKLARLFLRQHYRDWAEHHADHDYNRLARGFTYRGATYRAISAGDLWDKTITYELTTDPFTSSVPTEEITVTRYLDEQRAALDRQLESHHLLALQAPTGSGKTTFLIDYARRHRYPTVVAVPTINLARQLARRYRGYALTGTYSLARVRATIARDLIVCTYDTLHQVPDLWRRLLVIDEAHNLINQYGQVYRNYHPFRARTLRRCLRLLAEAPRVVLLSGTMPPLLCRALNSPLLTVRRRTNPNIRVFDIEADGRTSTALAKCLLTRLAEIDWSRPRLHVVFWNHTDQIEALRTALLDLGCLAPDQIAVVSRSHYNRGEASGLDDIIRDERVRPAIRLLLCTCLISEGVNIRNTNVGRVFTVGLRCEDTFRQFIARFRKLMVLNVFSILEAERDLHPDFFPSAEQELSENTERAALQSRHLSQRERAWREEYADDELPFLDDIERENESTYATPGSAYRNRLLQLTYAESRRWQPDILHALAAIHGRKLATANNCYFYTRLRNAGCTVLRVQRLTTADLIEEMIEARGRDEKCTLQVFRERLLRDLLHTPRIPLNALLLWYQEQGNRHGQALLRTLCPGMLDTASGASGAAYLHRHRREWTAANRRLIVRTARLHFLGVTNPEPYLHASIAAFGLAYRAAVFYFEYTLYHKLSTRKLLQSAHKEEIRIKHRIRKHLGADAGAEFSGKALLAHLQPLLRVRRVSPSPSDNQAAPSSTTLDLTGLTPARAINLVRELLPTQVTGSGRSRTLTLLPPDSEADPATAYFPPLAREARHLLREPRRVLQILGP